MPTRFINELNYDKKPYDSFDKGPAKIGYVNELAEVLETSGSFSSFVTQAIVTNNTAVNANLGTTIQAAGMTLAADALSVRVDQAGTYSFDATMQFFKKILEWVRNEVSFNRKVQTDMDDWITARHPQNAADVDMLIKQYH
jgi:hypothetical protein